MPDTTLTAFLKDSDQAARRAELAAFCGPRPDKFMRIYDSMAAVANRPPGERPKFKFFDGGFCWPAFFLGPIWMFYRKMWVYAGIVLAILFIFSLLPLPRGVGVGLGVAIASVGARLYVTHAISTINKLRGNPAQLAAASGVSLLAGWISGVLYVLLAGYLAIHMANAERTQRGLGSPSSLTQPFPH